MNKLKTKAFTLVELVVVITILAILGTIAFISLSGYSESARDSTRISDLSSIKTSLELFQLEAGKYPLPTDGINITYSGSAVWNQGIFGKTVYVNVSMLDKIPLDPIINKEYTYSVITNRNEYQLGGIVEGGDISFNNNMQTNAGETTATAYVTGNYNGEMTKSNSGTICNILAIPTIITNDTSVTDLQQIVSNNSFVFRGYKNLPSSFKTSKFKYNGGFAFTPNNLVAYTDTGSCNSLTDKNIYTSRVQLLKGLQNSYSGTTLKNEGEIKNILALNISTASPSDEVINYAGNYVNNNLGGKIVVDTLLAVNGCTEQPTYTNAIFTTGIPTQVNQSWQSLNSNVACYWTCGVGKVLLGNNCVSENCNGTTPNGTSEISNATSTAGGTWNYNTTPGICTYSCNTGYTWNGTSCNINTYTVSGSFGAGANGATINVCGTNLTADSSGNFSTTRNYGSTCNTITATRTNYTCNTTTNGPASLISNTTNITGNCTANFVCGTSTVSAGGFTYTTKTGPDGKCWTSQNMQHLPLAGASQNTLCYGTTPSNCTTYGRLYTWYATMGLPAGSTLTTEDMTQSVCGQLGTGWYLPTDVQFAALVTAGATGWTGNKLSGIVSSLPGYSTDGSSYGGINTIGYRWSSVQGNTTGAWSKYLVSSDSIVRVSNYAKASYVSVICIKN